MNCNATTPLPWQTMRLRFSCFRDILIFFWTDKQETKAAVDNLTRNALWEGLPECYDEQHFTQFRRTLYDYFYTRYKEIA